MSPRDSLPGWLANGASTRLPWLCGVVPAFGTVANTLAPPVAGSVT
ncbi:hypothetical protein SALBM311S_04808 [Streptomyces alboniger]